MRSSSRAALCVRASPGTGACETHGTVTEPRTYYA